MAKSDLRIDILGTSITISTDEEEGYLNALLDKYRRTIENVERVSGLRDPLKIAVLTGFLLSDDLEKAGKNPPAEKTGRGSGGEPGEAEQLTLGMISRLDEALGIEAAAPFTVEGETTPPARAEICPLPEKKIISVFKLQNTVKNYRWGSPEWIPSLLGQRNLSRVPWAELWMGVNPAGPSRVLPSGGSGENETASPPLLSDLIKSDPAFFLGKETADSPGVLPFLFKVEAAAKPLSIQAHPGREQAREGFERENRQGLSLDDPARNYRDENHKPEIISALTGFAALCGFREARQIYVLLDVLLRNSDGALKAGLENLCAALAEEDKPLKAFLRALFDLENEAREALGPFIRTRQSLFQRDYPEYRDEWELCSYLAGLYPGDPGILAPLYLNIIELAPGEAMYLPAGVLHTYIHGLGIELMADSDNVLRGGLTSKHVDRQELFRVLDFAAYKPEILKIPGPAPAWYRYPVPCADFSLSILRGGGEPDAAAPENAVPYPETGPSIVIITGGSAALSETGKEGEVFLKTGESVFIPAGKQGKIVFSGTFTAYAASAGKGGTFAEAREVLPS